MTRRMFVYNLPYSVRKKLCQILDASDKWEELGGEFMKYDYTYLQCIRRKDSPTDELLMSWGNQNHTVNELFVLFSQMQHYRAMNLLKEYVDEQYHHLLPEGEEFLCRPSSSKMMMDQVNPNRSNWREDESPSPQVGPSTAPPLQLAFTDSKDLGLDLRNLNFIAQKSDNKEKRKTVNEEKIQNIELTKTQNIDHSANAQNNNVNGQLQNLTADGRTNRVQERKLSNVSASSSVVEVSTPQISYEELVAATISWDTTNILGRGGFGTVFMGTWKNTLVAIKRLESPKDAHEQSSDVDPVQITQTVRELKYLNSHRHDNILSLYGYCITDNVSCLVYQYMANGSLEDRLQCRKNTRPLNWLQRLNIMTGTARGIQFLHSLGEKPLVHGDIKSANILLDNNFEPRIGDFGLAREGPQQQYTSIKVSRVHGTRPYLPDEFLRGKRFSVKVDTYSFGVVLFEVATGLRAYDENREEKFLKDHIVSFTPDLSCVADPRAGPDCCNSAAGLLMLGCNCVMSRPKDRPDMKSVLDGVNKLYNNYKGAEIARCLMQQGRLSPLSPIQLQIAYDTARDNGSPSPLQQLTPPDFQLAHPRDMIYYPPLPSPEPSYLPKTVGVKPLLPGSQPFPFPQQQQINHTPMLFVQPPSGQHGEIHSPPQGNSIQSPPLPSDACNVPMLTILGVKSESGITENPPLVLASQSSAMKTASEESQSSYQLSSIELVVKSVESVSSIPDEATGNNDLSDFSVSLPGEVQSACMPMISALLSK